MPHHRGQVWTEASGRCHCVLSATTLLFQETALLKKESDVNKVLVDVLQRNGLLGRDKVEAFFQGQAVCRGKCLGNLKRLVKLRADATVIESQLVDSFAKSLTVEPQASSPLQMNERTDLGTPIKRTVRSLPISNASSPTIAVSLLWLCFCNV